LKGKYPDLRALNGLWQSRFMAWSEVTLAPRAPDPVPHTPAPTTQSGYTLPEDWARFVAKGWPDRFVRQDHGRPWVASAENLFRRRLAARFGEVRQLNAQLGTRFGSFDEIPAPYALADWEETREEAGAMRAHFAARNYRVVFDFFATEGRSLWNTLIFCTASILVALTVNPLCAYALSRFQLSSGFRVLLFLLATIAFPAEVSMIPSFLLLKQFGMLNTFWALVLPGAANGYSIFLLKGFFDSLPLDLYEAGMLDGASELMLFRTVTLPLSTPILAVIALGAFTAAYGAFLFAMVVCQDPRMWTVMVHVYQIQVSEPRFVLMAALVLASLPTLVVFLFSQRVIMRGIILPSYK
jgi:multiple sugar transport system permease protein